MIMKEAGRRMVALRLEEQTVSDLHMIAEHLSCTQTEVMRLALRAYARRIEGIESGDKLEIAAAVKTIDTGLRRLLALVDLEVA